MLRWKGSTEINAKEIGWKGVYLIYLALNSDHGGCYVHGTKL
jgi:hypothetical protein